MNEQLQAALAEILGKANAGIDAGASFLQAQLPDVIQQLLMWKLAQAALGSTFLVVAFITAIVGGRWAVRIITEYLRGEALWLGHSGELERKGQEMVIRYGPRFWVAWPTLMVSAIAVIVAVFEAPKNIGTALQIWLAPKVYLIEYAASLAK